MRTGAAHRAEVPLTCLIEGAHSIEDAFAALRTRARSNEDARVILANMLAGYSRSRRRLDAHAVLATSRRTQVLRRAVSHLTDVDLDSAWRAALRRDDATVDARVLPHVDPRRPTPARKGSPWRSSDWITGRASTR